MFRNISGPSKNPTPPRARQQAEPKALPGPSTPSQGPSKQPIQYPANGALTPLKPEGHIPNFSRPFRADGNAFRAPQAPLTHYDQVPAHNLTRTGEYTSPWDIPQGMPAYPPPGGARVDLERMGYHPAHIHDAGVGPNRPGSPASDHTGVPPTPPPSTLSRPSSPSSSDSSSSRPSSSSSISSPSSTPRSSTSSDHDPFYFDRPEIRDRFRAPSPSRSDASEVASPASSDSSSATGSRQPIDRPPKGMHTPRVEPQRGVWIGDITTPTSESDPVGFALSRLNGEHLKTPTKSASVPIPRGPDGKPEIKRSKTD